MYICGVMNDYITPDIYEKSDNDIVVDLGRRFRNYRVALRLTQKEVAEQAGVSVMTVVRFEKGETTAIRLDNLIALVRAIQTLEGIAEAIPDVPTSLYSRSTADATNKRAKKRRDEK